MDCGMITQYPFPFLQDVIRHNKMGYTYKIKIISNTYKQQWWKKKVFPGVNTAWHISKSFISFFIFLPSINLKILDQLILGL